MLVISQRAGKALESILEQAEVPAGECVRLAGSWQGPVLAFDMERSGDEVVTFHGRKVLVMDPMTAETCVGQVLDCVWSQFFFSHDWAMSHLSG